MRQVIANASVKYGDVAVFDYRGVPHFAVVEGMGTGVFYIRETNYHRCKFSQRTIKFDDPALVGFYTPPQ